MSKTYDEIAKELSKARRVLFVTGAGISADSGLPTYRGVGGLYNGDATEDGLAIEDALSGECLAQRPDITWKYLAQIEHNCHAVAPNAAHRAIASLQAGREVVVLTQNIDGLHTQAGSTDVIEIHGSLAARHCTSCGAAADISDRAVPPLCSGCGGIVRPNVVLFGGDAAGGSARTFVQRAGAWLRHGLRDRHERCLPLHRRTGDAGGARRRADCRNQPGPYPS